MPKRFGSSAAAISTTTPITPLTQGGTGADTAAGARTNLELGDLAVLDSVTLALLEGWVAQDDFIIGGATGWERKTKAQAKTLLGASTPSVTSVSTTYTVADGVDIIIADATGGAFTITLPLAKSGRLLRIKKVDSSANAVTIAASGGETIDGQPTHPLEFQYDARTLFSDDTEWFII